MITQTENYDHFILTRFNVPSEGKESLIRDKPEWLKNRFVLFDKYCFPSVKNQTNQNFKWLIFFDDQTPPAFKQKIKSYSKYEKLIPIYVEKWEFSKVKEAINKLVNKDYILTSRLDNDDGLNINYIETLKNNITTTDDAFYNFSYGITLHKNSVFKQKHLSNAFISRLEKTKNFKTVWDEQHQNIIKTHKTIQLDLEAAWLQVIHGENVSNCTRGKLSNNLNLKNGYPHIEYHLIKNPNITETTIDYLIKQPYRNTRDILRRAGKKVIDILKT